MTGSIFEKVGICILFFVVLIFLSAKTTNAEDIYYAQAQAGDHGGGSCANAKALSALTWSGGAGSIDAGDTLHLCGTLTSNLVIGGSGSAGSVITVKFEDGAKFSKAYWGDASASAIYAAGKSYVRIDGGTNGKIEATANGSNLANQTASNGIYLTGCTNIEITNMNIGPMYVRSSASDTIPRTANTYPIIILDTISGISVHNNVLHDGETGVAANFSSNQSGTFSIYNNTISHVSNGMTFFGHWQNAYTFSGTLNFYNNTVSIGNDWGGNNAFHEDYFQTDMFYSTAANINVYNNYMGSSEVATPTSMNSWVFMQTTSGGHHTNVNIYNNILWLGPGGESANPFINIQADTAYIYNNTVVGGGNSGAGCLGVNIGTYHIKNNICKETGYSLAAFAAGASIDSDYNDYYRASGLSFYDPYGSPNSGIITLAQWAQNHSGDSHSISTNPNLNSNYSLPSGSVAIDKGTPLGSPYNVDYIGTSRPQGAAWDIGAYEGASAYRLDQKIPNWPSINIQ